MANKKGFTLVEVIAVTLIIAALALLVVPSFKNSALTSQMEKAKVGLIELTTAVKLYNEVHSTPLSGVLNTTMFETLSTIDENQGYRYLQHPARWAIRPNSFNQYSLLDSDGALNCRYTVGDTQDASILTQTKCSFRKIDQEGTECYMFYVQRNNPAVIKKKGEPEVSCNDL